MPPLLGAHMSIVGGVHRAVEAARDAGCDVVQLFTTPPRQWPRRKPMVAARGQAASESTGELPWDEVVRFQQALKTHRIQHPLCHASYLINLASPDEELWRKSMEALVVELERAERLAIPAVVVHPGAFTTSSEAAGMKRIIQALREIDAHLGDARVMCLLETMAGGGSILGHRFEHIARLLDGAQNPDRYGVCLDTCHVFAAGYPLQTAAAYRRTMNEFARSVGFDVLRAVHLNDSQHAAASQKDRHAHIGHGQVGIDVFRRLLNDERFARVPMYLETEKGQQHGKSWDEINLATLRCLIDP